MAIHMAWMGFVNDRLTRIRLFLLVVSPRGGIQCFSGGLEDNSDWRQLPATPLVFVETFATLEMETRFRNVKADL
jgi:hypothetical protein